MDKLQSTQDKTSLQSFIIHLSVLPDYNLTIGMTGPAEVIPSVYLSSALNLPVLTCYCYHTNWP